MTGGKAPRKAGDRFERTCVHHFRDEGYPVVARAAGSLGIVEVVAAKQGQVLFVQCKRHGELNPAEWNQLYALATACGAVPLCARAGRRVTDVVLMRLLGPKLPGGGVQPWEPFVTDEIAAAVAEPSRCRKCNSVLSACMDCGVPTLCGEAVCAEHLPEDEGVTDEIAEAMEGNR